MSANCITVIQPCVRIEKAEWLARRAELQNKPSFADHTDAKCFAQNSDGSWHKHTEARDARPINGFWAQDELVGGVWLKAQKGEVIGDWRDTLEKRPEEFKLFISIEDNQEQDMKQDNKWFERGELPPVGVVCIFEPGSGSCYFNEYDLKASGKIVKIIAHTRYEHSSCDVAVFRWDLDGCFGVSTGNTQSFRPIRTERDVLLSVIVEEMNHYDTDGKLADSILAAGFSLRDK